MARGPRPDRPRGGDAHRRVRVRLQPARVRTDDVARPQVGEQPVRRFLLYGQLPRRADVARGARRHAAPADGPGAADLAEAAARPGQAVLRLHGVLGLSHVGPVPGDLVREPPGGDVLHLLSADRPVAAGGLVGLPAGVRDSILGPARLPPEYISYPPTRHRPRLPPCYLALASHHLRAL